jgi:hypothetical protein
MCSRFLLIGFLCLAALGCGSNDGPESVEVRGKVTVNGQPVEGLKVLFRLPDGPQAIGTTNTEGAYELVLPGGVKGAQVGSNIVSITGRDPRISPEIIAEMKAEASANNETFIDPTKLPVIPARYNEKTELTAEVSNGKTVFDYDLTVTSKGK